MNHQEKKQINHDKHPDESKTTTHRFSKLIQIQKRQVPGLSIVGQLTESVVTSILIHHGGYHSLFVCL